MRMRGAFLIGLTRFYGMGLKDFTVTLCSEGMDPASPLVTVVELRNIGG